MDAGYYNGMGEAGGTADTSNLSGKELLGKFECTRCHGDDLNGTPMAPPLKGMAKYYDRESLIAYLRSPERNQTGTRFDEYKTKYATGVMPAFRQQRC
jgi:Cytochrome c.